MASDSHILPLIYDYLSTSGYKNTIAALEQESGITKADQIIESSSIRDIVQQFYKKPSKNDINDDTDSDSSSSDDSSDDNTNQTQNVCLK